MRLKQFIKDLILDSMIIGDSFHVTCPRCKHNNRVCCTRTPGANLVCWCAYEQYAEAHKESFGEYPRCNKCGTELKP